MAGTLSGGEQQQLAIARALMSRPRMLLLDEPSLGLAPIFVDRIFELIQELRSDGVTILLVEQNVHRALEIADRAYVLSVGKVVASGATDQLMEGELERSYLGISQADEVMRVSPSEFVQQLVNALSLGSIYALLALGLSMVYGVLGMLNFAYGELVTITGYAMLAATYAGLPFIVVALIGVLAAGVSSVLMELIAFRPLRNASFVSLLFTSFAVAQLIQGAFRQAVSVRSRGIPVPAFFDEAIQLGPVRISVLSIITAGIGAISLVALTTFMRRSRSGLAMRAASADFTTARLMGVRANRVISLAFLISGLLAGIAGVLWIARTTSVNPTTGFVPVIQAFIASVIGGLGNLRGAVLGGLLPGHARGVPAGAAARFAPPLRAGSLTADRRRDPLRATARAVRRARRGDVT